VLELLLGLPKDFLTVLLSLIDRYANLPLPDGGAERWYLSKSPMC
jgi:hypothetical protein